MMVTKHSMWAAHATLRISYCNETPGFPCFKCVSFSERDGKLLCFADAQPVSVIDFSPLLITQMLLLLHLLLCFQEALQITWVMCSNRDQITCLVVCSHFWLLSYFCNLHIQQVMCLPQTVRHAAICPLLQCHSPVSQW